MRPGATSDPPVPGWRPPAAERGVPARLPPRRRVCKDRAVMTNGYLAPVLSWYASHARELPWRQPGVSPWAVLVSEVMLQQTPVSRVLPAYQAWLERWPTPAALAADPPG